ncbi:MAG: hypothetical protein K2Q45_03915 [Nitrosomonas sp.]|nr:hypothetical protein [Nitrosomonas sp.]
MFEKLCCFKPTTDKHILLVEAATGEERKHIHQWAAFNGLRSTPSQAECFPRVTGFKCKECKFVQYNTEEIWHSDYSMITVSVYDYYVKCPQCDDSFLYLNDIEDNAAEDGTIKHVVLFNCVAIATNMNSLKKFLGNKRRKKKKMQQHQQETEFHFLKTLFERDVVMALLE